MAFAKMSVVAFIRLLNPHQDKSLRIIETVAISVWALFSLFAISFQCDLPRSWIFTTESCANGALLYVVVSTNLLTDLYLAVIFTPVAAALEMSSPKRVEVMAYFGCRIL